MIEYHVHFIRFPSGKVHEAFTVNEDDSFSIFLDKNATYESQCESFRHVMNHIEQNDFEKSDVQKIESIAHAER